MGKSKRLIEEQREEARLKLLEWLRPGDTVYTILRRVSRSGMLRVIGLVAMIDGQPEDITYWAGRLLDWPIDKSDYGLRVSGCGMNMRFHTVYCLGRAMYPDGVACAGERCHSNDHINPGPQRDRRGPNVIHRDSGYAFKERGL